MLRVFFCAGLLLQGSAAYGLTGFKDLAQAEEKTPPLFEEFEAVQAPAHQLLENSTQKGSMPDDTPAAVDPVSGRYYQKAFAGKAHKAPFLASYDYWRYVTVYNVKTVAERVAYLPYFEEGCHDASWAMAEWGESRTLKVSLSSSLGAEALGLQTSISMSIESGVTFSASRRIQAIKGIAARHYPYKLSDVWEGVTYIQVYYKDKNRFGYLKKARGFNRWQEYPFPFSLDNQNVGFKVKREVLNKCENYDPDSDTVPQNILYIR